MLMAMDLQPGTRTCLNTMWVLIFHVNLIGFILFCGFMGCGPELKDPNIAFSLGGKTMTPQMEMQYWDLMVQSVRSQYCISLV